MFAIFPFNILCIFWNFINILYDGNMGYIEYFYKLCKKILTDIFRLCKSFNHICLPVENNYIGNKIILQKKIPTYTNICFGMLP